jgi:D-psicose/D-tagatose/L-ribulose 3-epimerase
MQPGYDGAIPRPAVCWNLFMARFSFILCDPLESFGSLAAFGDVLAVIKDLGFAGVEFNLTTADLPQAEALLTTVRRAQLPVVSFLTGANYFRQGLCLCARDEAIRRNAVEGLCHLAAAAARFDAILVVGQMQGFRSDEPDVSAAEQRIAAGLRQVAVAAEKAGTTVAIEPVNHLQCGFHNSLDAVLGLTRSIGSPRVKPMLDSFHMNIEESSQAGPIRRAGADLAHFHQCETNGGALGSGHLNVPEILETLDAIGYPGYVSVKVYRQDWRTAALATRDSLRAMGIALG